MSHFPAARAKRIPELDGLRAFAVLAVVVYHLCDVAGSLPRGPYGIATIVTLLGPSGVSVFFIISGYIITTLLLREKRSFGQVSLQAFYVRRFFRIVPPFLTYLLGLVALGALGVIHVSRGNLFWSALFLGNTGLLDSQAWFVAHTWSLSVEEQFYLVFPPLLCVVLGFRTRLVVLPMAVFYGLCLVSLKLAHDLSLHLAPPWIGLSALYHFRYIIVGVLLATHGGSFLPLLRGKSGLWPLSLAAIVFFLHWVSVPSFVSVLFAAIEPCLCGLFVMWFVENPERCALLRTPVIQWIGACSYSIYLWQQLFTGPADFYPRWKLAHTPLCLFALTICAAASFYFVERPSMRLGRMLSRRLRPPENDDKNSTRQSA